MLKAGHDLNRDIDVGSNLVNKNTLFCSGRAETKLSLKPDQHLSSAAENPPEQITRVNVFGGNMCKALHFLKHNIFCKI